MPETSSHNLNGVRIIFAGSGEFGMPALSHMIARGATIAAVYTQPRKPAGRGNKLTPTPIGQFAEQHTLPLIETADINAESLPPADVLVVIAFGQKLSPAVVAHARLGAINLHSSRLPRYRGAAPINWAVINGDEFTGNSVIRLAQTMDAGGVLAMSQVVIGPHETAGELHDRLSADGAPLIEGVLAALVSTVGRMPVIEQDHSQATRAPKLSRQSSAIQWGDPAKLIANQIRGMYPWPGCRVVILDGDREIARCTLVRSAAHEKTWHENQVGFVADDLSIACGVGSLSILELQPEGKRPMPFNSFLNGHRWTVGMRLESL